MSNLIKTLQSSLFWWAVFLVPALAIVVGLYFQYGLDEGPCALCVHIRIYLAGLMLLGIIGLLFKGSFVRLINHMLTAALCIGLAFTCWELYGVEKGFIAAGCSMGAGLPAWFNLEDWMPSLFASWGLCGITPDVIWGISMAEALMPTSIIAAVAATAMAVFMAVMFKRNRHINIKS